MARMTYTSEHYDLITREEMDEGMDCQIGSLEPDPSLKGVRLALRSRRLSCRWTFSRPAELRLISSPRIGRLANGCPLHDSGPQHSKFLIRRRFRRRLSLITGASS